MKQVAFLGVDYHIKTITIAIYLAKEKKFYETIRLNNDDKTIKKYMKKLSTQFDLKMCYEASCSGYVFQRKMHLMKVSVSTMFSTVCRVVSLKKKR